MIKVDVLENGTLSVFEKTVSDSVMFEKIKFSFPKSWETLTKTVVFKNGDTTVELLLNAKNQYCIGQDECLIPFEVIKPPFFTVSVFGLEGDRVATTVRGEIEVLESGYEEGDAPQEPTQSVYAQILDETQKATRIAQSVRDDADSGKFKGEKGEKGDKGDDGNATTTDQNYNPQSENAQSGKAVAEALLSIQTDENGSIVVDQTFNPLSENAQSGKAVDEAIKTQVGNSQLAEALKEQNKSGEFTVWVGTQAEYDAISEKVANRFYLITDDNKVGDIEIKLEQNSVETIYAQNYYYEKRGDGVLKCKGKYSFKGNFTSSYGNAFYSSQISLPLSDLFSPVANEIKEIWNITATIGGTNEFLGVNIANYDAENIVFYVFSHKEFAEEKEAVVTFELLGKWK